MNQLFYKVNPLDEHCSLKLSDKIVLKIGLQDEAEHRFGIGWGFQSPSDTPPSIENPHPPSLRLRLYTK